MFRNIYKLTKQVYAYMNILKYEKITNNHQRRYRNLRFSWKKMDFSNIHLHSREKFVK